MFFNLRSLKEFNLHPDLISLYTDNVSRGIIGVNILSPIVFIIALYPFVPMSVLGFWMAAHLLFGYLRHHHALNLAKAVKEKSEDAAKIAAANVAVIGMNGLLWGLAAVMTSHYAPTIYNFLAMGIIVSLISGSVVRLSPLIQGFYAFLSMSILPLWVVFMLSEESIYLIMAAMMILTSPVMIMAGYNLYLKFSHNILLQEQLKGLNENLELEVNKRTLELDMLNQSLEKRVIEEVEANRQKEQQLMHQSRLAQMGEMISMIAHQWRQPLTAINSTSMNMKMKFLFDEYDLSDADQRDQCKHYFDEQLSEIDEYVQSLTTTIDDFRNFYKPNKNRHCVSVNEPIHKALGIIKQSIEAAGTSIELHFDAKQVVEQFDGEMMHVYLNMLKNAQDNFMERKIQDPKITISTIDTDQGAEVIISDNGGGIEEQYLDKIFDPYFSTKDTKNGTGLGLYMSKTIVEDHHKGKLRVYNENDGVTFCIAFILCETELAH